MDGIKIKIVTKSEYGKDTYHLSPKLGTIEDYEMVNDKNEGVWGSSGKTIGEIVDKLMLDINHGCCDKIKIVLEKEEEI